MLHLLEKTMCVEPVVVFLVNFLESEQGEVGIHAIRGHDVSAHPFSMDSYLIHVLIV